MEVRRLTHDVLARKVIATLLEYIDQGLGKGPTGTDKDVRRPASRIVFLQPVEIKLGGRVIFPTGVRGILSKDSRDDADRILQSPRLEHSLDRLRTVGQEMQRFPTKLVGFADRLRREFRRGDIVERVSTRRL